MTIYHDKSAMERGLFLGIRHGMILGQKKGCRDTKILIVERMLDDGLGLDIVLKYVFLSQEELFEVVLSRFDK